MKMKYAAALLDSKKTVFTYESAGLILSISNKFTLRNILNRLVKANILVHKYAGVWALSDYTIFEFASVLHSPSYISLETVLQKHGIIFQDYSGVLTMVSDISLQKTIDNRQYQYRKLRDSILLDPLGLVYKDNYVMASPERAVTDMLYFASDYFFDHPYDLDLDVLESLKHLYPPKTILAITKLIEYVRYSKA